MALVDSSGFAHVRLTVTDIARSKAFYDRVFGWPAAIDASDRVDEPGVRSSPEQFYGGVVYQTPSGALFGLRPVAPPRQRFNSEHTGLDHLSFQVSSRDELLTARQRLDEAAIQHGEVIDLADTGLAILSFSDPDGVHLELTAPLT
jgi:catechol 2,3-dioxygenase-like lactoylglutathione lyase family enzyme